ncbi:hypothetical protein ACA910_022509 [Epithemia clementina (nom. ined.)]
MAAYISVLLLQTQCDFSQLPALWADLEETTKDPHRRDWKQHLSHERLKEAPLRCDILLLPSGKEDEEIDADDGDDDSFDEENGNSDIFHRRVDHDMIVFTGQMLQPCGIENVLSLEQDKSADSSNFFHLSLSDCALQISESLWLTLSPSENHIQPTFSGNGRYGSGYGIQMAQTTRSLSLDLYLDEKTKTSLKHLADNQENQNDVQKGNIEHNLEFSSPGPISGETHCQIPEHTSAPSTHLNNLQDIPIPKHCQQYNHDPCTYSPCFSPVEQPSQYQRASTHQQQLLLLEQRLQEELHSIQFLTNLMVILPSLVLLVMGVWMIQSHWKSFSPQKTVLPHSLLAESPKLSASTHVSGRVHSANATPAKASPVTPKCEQDEKSTSTPLRQVLSTNKNSDEYREKTGVCVKKLQDTHASPSHFVQDTTSTSYDAIDEPIVQVTSPLSPCSLLKLQWNTKQQLKRQRKQLEALQKSKEEETIATSYENRATLVSPDSTPEPKLKRSTPGMTNLLLAGQTVKCSRPLLTPDYGAEGNGEKRKVSHRLRTNTFVDDYWCNHQ